MAVGVTGAGGFIGRHVLRALQMRGHRVVGIDRRPWTPAPGETAVLGDLLDPTALGALRTVDAIVHLAGRPGVRSQGAAADTARWRDNVLAGAAVLAAAPRSVPVIVASSSSVYGGAGAPDAPRPCHEDDPLQPRGAYARSKVALETLARSRHDAGGAVAVVRPFTVAGEGQRADMAIARWIDAALTGRPLTVLGSPDRRRDVTDARHVADAIVAVLERDVRATINLGTGTAHPLRDIVAAVARATDRPVRTRVLPAGREEVPATRADTKRCRELLGLVPTTDLDDLVARQMAARDGRYPALALSA